MTTPIFSTSVTLPHCRRMYCVATDELRHCTQGTCRASVEVFIYIYTSESMSSVRSRVK